MAGAFYVVNERAVQSFNSPGQPVNRLMNATMREAVGYAKGYLTAGAGLRSGNLQRSIGRMTARRRGFYRLQGEVHAKADYAAFVHDGTSGPIRAKGGGKMRLPRQAGAIRGAGLPNNAVLYKDSVRGQSANPFLRRGVSLAMRRSNKLFYGRRS